MQSDQTSESGPFDIIGDIHGCFDETYLLLQKLGYTIHKNPDYKITHPQGRRLIFLGDLVDRGPHSPAVLQLVMNAVASGIAFCVNGNHDDKLRRTLLGNKVTIAHGLQETLDQLSATSENFKQQIITFLSSLASHYVLDAGKLVVAHAGIKEKFFNQDTAKVRSFCMYGDTTGKFDEAGLPIRRDWAAHYQGKACIVYGHTPVKEAKWLNNTINIDTACVFGGELTALRYPEKELVSVSAAKIYYVPIKPIE